MPSYPVAHVWASSTCPGPLPDYPLCLQEFDGDSTQRITHSRTFAERVESRLVNTDEPTSIDRQMTELDEQIEALNRQIARRAVEISDAMHNLRRSRNDAYTDARFLQHGQDELIAERARLQEERELLSRSRES